MQVLIDGWYYRITKRNEVVYHGKHMSIIRDVYGNFWVLIDGDLIQLRTFCKKGKLIYFKTAQPEFLLKAPVSKLVHGAEFKLWELDQFWSLDRSEFYMLMTYRITD